MGDEPKFTRGKMEVGGLIGPLWFTGWLFTLGYLHLNVVKALIAIVIWPYYLGASLGH